MVGESGERLENYIVLINHEEQHSLWPVNKAIPAGWRQVGPCGAKAECLEYVEKAWTDITPLSARNLSAGPDK